MFSPALKTVPSLPVPVTVVRATSPRSDAGQGKASHAAAVFPPGAFPVSASILSALLLVGHDVLPGGGALSFLGPHWAETRGARATRARIKMEFIVFCCFCLTVTLMS